MSLPFLAALGGASALLLAALLTPAVRSVALRGGLVRGAQADRWHKRPTPAVGGIAIFASFLGAVGVLLLAGEEILLSGLEIPVPRAVLPWPFWLGLLAGSATAFAVGVVDDLRPLRPLTKLAGQMVAATLLILSGIGVWLTGVYLLDAAISLFWFLAVTNALNLLDNMDGVAAGTAAIAAGFLAVLALLEGQAALFVVAISFVGATLGFLAHNYPPARIFMGDSGSLFLGLFLAGMALMPAPGLSRSLLAILAAPALVLAIPLLDTTLVTVGRVLEGRPISQGGTDHTSHRLVALGASEERTLWTLWILALLGGGVGLLLRTAARAQAALLGGLLLVALVLIAVYLLRVRFQAFSTEVRERVPLYRVVLELHQRFPVGSFLLDALLLGLAYYGAYLLRWDAQALEAELAYFQTSVTVVVAAKLLAFTVSGVYGHRWEGFGLQEGWRLLRANGLGTVLALTGLFLVERVGLSRGVFALDLLLATVLTLGVRLSFRVLERSAGQWARSGVPALLVGGPTEVRVLLRLLEAGLYQADGVEELRPVAIADPHFSRSRAAMQGLPVYGTPQGVEEALRQSRAGAVVLLDAGTDGLPSSVRSVLEGWGAVDVYRLRVGLERERG